MKKLRNLMLVGLVFCFFIPQAFAGGEYNNEKAIKEVRKTFRKVCFCMPLEETLCANECVTLTVTVQVNENNELELLDVKGDNEKCVMCFTKSFNKKTRRVKHCKPGCQFRSPVTLMLKE